MDEAFRNCSPPLLRTAWQRSRLTVRDMVVSSLNKWAHPLSSSCTNLSGFWSFSVLCTRAWHHNAHCSLVLGGQQAYASYTTSVQFYRWVSLSRWTSESGICTTNRDAGELTALRWIQMLGKKSIRRHRYMRHLLSSGLGLFGTWSSGSLGLWSGSRPWTHKITRCIY